MARGGDRTGRRVEHAQALVRGDRARLLLQRRVTGLRPAAATDPGAAAPTSLELVEVR